MLNKRLFQKVLLDFEQERQWQFFCRRGCELWIICVRSKLFRKKRSFL